MKKTPLIYFLLLYSMTAVVTSARLGAQEGVGLSRTAIDMLVNPPLLRGGERILHFDSCRKYIGTLTEDDTPHAYRFPFRNTSGTDVRITRVTTSCGCAAADFDRRPLAPGKESVITVAYNPKNHPGTVDAQAFVYIDASDNRPVARLTLSGNVTTADEWDYLPYSAGSLRMKRRKVFFSEITPSSRPSERILCANIGGTPLKLEVRMLPPYASFHTEPATLLPGEEGDIVLTVDGGKLPANRGKELHFSFFIEGANVNPAGSMIEVTVKQCTH